MIRCSAIRVLSRQHPPRMMLCYCWRQQQRPSSARASSFGFRPVAWYSRMLDKYPVWTKCISSGIVSGGGDVLGQYIASNGREWNWDMLRTGRFALLGFALVAPVVHVWYGYLMKRFPNSLVQRVLLDQLIFAPLFLPTWLVNLWVLQGKSSLEWKQELHDKVPNMLVANWALWIPAQIVNLGFVPPKYQVLFSNVVAMAWNTFLSLTTQQQEQHWFNGWLFGRNKKEETINA